MNICILLSMTTLAGWLNCPFLVPSVPNLLWKLPSLLNTQMRLLLRSATTIRPLGVQQMPQGRHRSPSPLPSWLNSSTGLQKKYLFDRHKKYLFVKKYLPAHAIVIPSRLHQALEGAVLNVAAVQRHLQLVLANVVWMEYSQIYY